MAAAVEPLCLEAVDIFLSFYGRFLSAAAVTFLPYGGLHVAGGVLPKVRLPSVRAGCVVSCARVGWGGGGGGACTRMRRARSICGITRACWVAAAARARTRMRRTRARARARVTCPAQLAWRVPCLGGSAPADVLLEVCCWSSCACVFLCVRLCAYVCVWQFASVSFCVPCCVCVVWVCVG